MRAQDEFRQFFRLVLRSSSIWCFSYMRNPQITSQTQMFAENIPFWKIKVALPKNKNKKTLSARLERPKQDLGMAKHIKIQSLAHTIGYYILNKVPYNESTSIILPSLRGYLSSQAPVLSIPEQILSTQYRMRVQHIDFTYIQDIYVLHIDIYDILHIYIYIYTYVYVYMYIYIC